MDDRPCDQLRAAARHAGGHGHQRGLLHSGRPGADRRFPHRAARARARSACTRWASTSASSSADSAATRPTIPTSAGGGHSTLCGLIGIALCGAAVHPAAESAEGRPRRPRAADVAGRGAARAAGQRIVRAARALLHAARARGLGGSRLDARDSQGGVRHRSGPRGCLGDALLAGGRHRRRADRRVAGGPLDAAHRIAAAST